MKMVRRPEGEKGRTMNERRCALCGLWACEHVKAPSDKGSTVVSLGDKVGDDMPSLADTRLTLKNEVVQGLLPKTSVPTRVRVVDVPSTRIAKEEEDNTLYNITTSKVTSTIPMGPVANAQRVLIPPPPKVPAIAGPSTPITKVTEDEWVNCNICKAKVSVKYLDAHQKMHIGTHSSASRAIVTTTSTTGASATGSSSAVTVYSSKKEEKKDNSKPKLSPQEHYKFKGIDTACAASSTSQDGRYSDLTIIYWMKDKPSVTTTYYAGGSSTTTSNVGERLSVHIVYDSVEDYYTVTTKLLKRSSYSTWDTEENVPDRICANPRELLEEIKRALLFFCISPKVAYKKFRKLFKQELKIDYDTAGRACICQTKNCEELFERLKKTSSTSEYGGHGYDGHGWYGSD